MEQMSKRSRLLESAIYNNETYLMYYNRLRDYALNMYKWEGLPDSINERFLEILMYRDGKAIFFKDPQMSYMALGGSIGSPINVYEEPTEIRAISINYQRLLTPDECVIIWSNYSRTSLDPIIRAYARRLYAVERAMDININSTKTPILILADESQRLTLKNAYDQFEHNEPFIFGNRQGFDKEAFQVLKTDAPMVLDKLWEYKHNLFNEVFSFLGVGNGNQQKKERLVSAEVSSNDEQIEGSRYIWLNARQEACKRINELFGLNVSVKFKLEDQPEPAAASEEKKEDDIDGQ
jgi:Phage Connector (GP10)